MLIPPATSKSLEVYIYLMLNGSSLPQVPPTMHSLSSWDDSALNKNPLIDKQMTSGVGSHKLAYNGGCKLAFLPWVQDDLLLEWINSREIWMYCVFFFFLCPDIGLRTSNLKGKYANQLLTVLHCRFLLCKWMRYRYK